MDQTYKKGNCASREFAQKILSLLGDFSGDFWVRGGEVTFQRFAEAQRGVLEAHRGTPIPYAPLSPISHSLLFSFEDLVDLIKSSNLGGWFRRRIQEW